MIARILRTKFITPKSNCFITQCDTSFSQQLFYILATVVKTVALTARLRKSFVLLHETVSQGHWISGLSIKSKHLHTGFYSIGN